MNLGRLTTLLFAAALLAAGLLACAGAGAAPDRPVERASRAFHQALGAGDAAALERLLTEKFTWTREDGRTTGRSELLRAVREKKTGFAQLEAREESVTEYKNAAVASGRSEVVRGEGAKPVGLRYTLTLIRTGREWKAAAYQTTVLVPGAGQPLQVRLGYPADAKLLILNADDLAVSHSEDAASFAAFDNKFITSATVMVPCPWFTEVAAFARSHPGLDLGLHLTLTAEWQTYRWGPITSRALVPSLVGPDGYFYPSTGEFARHAKPDEVELEIRAQIERAKSMGVEPSHLDAHMHSLYATPELFSVMLKVAREYKLPVRMARNLDSFRPALQLMRAEDPVPDFIFSPGDDVPAAGWKDYYLNLLKSLEPGVTEVFVHLAHDDAESQAIMVDHPGWGAAWRQREYDTVSSPEFRKALEENHVVLIGWRDLQKLM